MSPAHDREIEYTDEFISRLEVIWGEGFLSPGGAEDVGVWSKANTD